MNFLKKLFVSSDKTKDEEIKSQPVSLSIDDAFVHNFIKFGGKFLYCLRKEDVTSNLNKIIEENDWDIISYTNENLSQFITATNVKTTNNILSKNPFFTTCEQLIAENGSILFTSKQIEDKRLSTLTNDFIVYATTSQIVKNMGDSLTAIKSKYKNNLPTNISSIKNYDPTKVDDNFISYGSCNSKNLYLLLLEDL